MATQTTVLDLTKPAGNENALISVINSNMDKVDAEAGKTRGNFAGTYSSSRAYAVGDYCIYQGNLYRCTTAIGSGGEAWNSGHWTQVKAGTEIKSLSSQIANMGKLESGQNNIGHIYCVGYNTGSGNYVSVFVPVLTNGKTPISATADSTSVVYLYNKKVTFPSAPTITIAGYSDFGVRLEVTYPTAQDQSVMAMIYFVNFKITCS